MIKNRLQESKVKKKHSHIIEIVLSIISLTIFVFLAYQVIVFGQISPNSSVCGINLGWKNREKTKKILQSHIENISPVELVFNYKNQKIHYQLFSIDFQTEQVLNSVFRNTQISKIVSAEKKSFVFSPVDKNNEIRGIVDDLKNKINEDLKTPKIIKNGNQIVFSDIHYSPEIDEKQIEQLISSSLSCPQKTIELNIPLLEIPEKQNIFLENLKNRANKLLNKSIILLFKNSRWILNDEIIFSFLSASIGFDINNIENYIDNELSFSIETSPIDPVFVFENQKVSVFKPGTNGINIDKNYLIAKIQEKINQLETDNVFQEEIVIKTIETPPKTTIENVNSYGIKELVGKGQSNYKGSVKDRIFNLSLATERLNGILVAPNEEFSFLKSLGKVSTSTGYRQGFVIKEGKTVLDDGGGVCQVSTTLFRAILNSGLPITQRYAHSYRVSYYENDMGPGFDATIFEPNIDLKFVNNTPSYLLIQSSNDTVNKILTFEIYGKKDGRTVEISSVRITDKKEPPPDLYITDANIPVGTTKQTEHRIWGAKASFNYKVTNGDLIMENKTFVSVYRPWQAVFLQGTKQP